MKTVFAFSLFGFVSCFAHYHDTSANFNADYDFTSSLPKMGLTLDHQSSFDLDDGNIFILHGLSSPQSKNLFFNELGLGYRKLGHKFGFGTNFVYQHSNLLKFHTHQLVPGVELFGYHLTLGFNKYIPLQSVKKDKDNNYLYHDISEIFLSYKPSKKYEFGIAPYYNHLTKNVGYRGVVSAYFSENWKVSLEPYYDKISKGVICSLGFHFGGPKSRENQSFNKSHRFFYTSSVKEKTKPISLVAKPSLPPMKPIEEPMAFPVPMPFAPVITLPEPEPERVEVKIKDDPKEERSWVDYLFFWRTYRK